jgi:hypothetical protein
MVKLNNDNGGRCVRLKSGLEDVKMKAEGGAPQHSDPASLAVLVFFILNSSFTR